MPAVKLDENVPDSVGTILRESGHDVALARDEQLAGVPDDQLLTAAAGENRVLVSFDRGFANVIQQTKSSSLRSMLERTWLCTVVRASAARA